MAWGMHEKALNETRIDITDPQDIKMDDFNDLEVAQGSSQIIPLDTRVVGARLKQYCGLSQDVVIPQDTLRKLVPIKGRRRITNKKTQEHGKKPRVQLKPQIQEPVEEEGDEVQQDDAEGIDIDGLFKANPLVQIGFQAMKDQLKLHQETEKKTGRLATSAKWSTSGGVVSALITGGTVFGFIGFEIYKIVSGNGKCS